MAATVFSKIIAREIPARIEYEDNLCLVFHDAHPQAPFHLLIIPKEPIASLFDVEEKTAFLLGHLVVVATRIAAQLGLSSGYRLVVNCGPDGGQSVDHLHLHLLGGRALHWPPG
ncbi:MAG: histidine triad nucleotide-binding protein [Planctomycetaceae bacterium]|nr:MAG: histidine triad nucleotide-binding protein [Planctomycetaceae bacterium]